MNKLESIADPKQVLQEALRQATGLSGRRLKRFRPSSAVHRTAELIDDFSPLRALSAFRRLEESIAGAFSKLGLNTETAP